MSRESALLLRKGREKICHRVDSMRMYIQNSIGERFSPQDKLYLNNWKKGGGEGNTNTAQDAGGPGPQFLIQKKNAERRGRLRKERKRKRLMSPHRGVFGHAAKPFRKGK